MFILALAPLLLAQSQPRLVPDISARSIEIRYSFSGAQLLLFGAIAGLGHVLYQASLDIFPAMIVVGMAAVAVTGAAMTMVLGRIERHVLRWRVQR